MTLFADRHIGPRSDEIASMLAAVGYESLDGLTDAAVPGSIRMLEALDLPAALDERQTLDELRSLSRRN